MGKVLESRCAAEDSQLEKKLGVKTPGEISGDTDSRTGVWKVQEECVNLFCRWTNLYGLPYCSRAPYNVDHQVCFLSA